MNTKKVLIAVDESGYSEKAAKAGFQLAQQLGASVAMTYIISPVYVMAGMSPGEIPIDTEATQVESGKKLLSEYNKKYTLANSAEVFVQVASPAIGIMEVAEEWGADMIVIGKHGLESFKHIVFGGVVDEVAKHTKIPVVLIP